MHNGQRSAPLHVSLAGILHDDSRSESVIDVLNKLGLCVSYDEILRVDIGINELIIETAGSNRVPVSLPLNDDEGGELHGAMDNFDHDEATLSGIGGSHDTILMLFKNSNRLNNTPQSLSKDPFNSSKRPRLLKEILPCQELVQIGKFNGRGKVSSLFFPEEEPYFSRKEKEIAKQHRLWTLARYQDNRSAEYERCIPFFCCS